MRDLLAARERGGRERREDKDRKKAIGKGRQKKNHGFWMSGREGKREEGGKKRKILLGGNGRRRRRRRGGGKKKLDAAAAPDLECFKIYFFFLGWGKEEEEDVQGKALKVDGEERGGVIPWRNETSEERGEKTLKCCCEADDPKRRKTPNTVCTYTTLYAYNIRRILFWSVEIDGLGQLIF